MVDGTTMVEKGKMLPTHPTNDPEDRHDAVNHQNPMEEQDLGPIAHPDNTSTEKEMETQHEVTGNGPLRKKLKLEKSNENLQERKRNRTRASMPIKDKT
jgi:hypothetical protein